MALMQAGIPHKVIATSDINKYSNMSYEAIFGDNPNMGDICKIRKLPASDILIYSFPCTDLSIAATKTRSGMAEGANHRSSLIWEVRRLLSQCKEDNTLPTWLLMENVPAIDDRMNRPQFLKWLNVLGELGYTSEYGILNAAEFGMAQRRRRRMFVLSRLGGECPELPVGSGPKQVLEDVLEDEGGIDGKWYTPRTYRFIRDIPTERITGRCLQVGWINGLVRRSDAAIYSTKALCPTLTVTHGGNPHILTTGGVRSPTPRERWRLQGFPDWAYDRAAEVSSGHQLTNQAGNSIPVPVLEAIFGTVYEWDKQHGGIE